MNFRNLLNASQKFDHNFQSEKAMSTPALPLSTRKIFVQESSGTFQTCQNFDDFYSKMPFCALPQPFPPERFLCKKFPERFKRVKILTISTRKCHFEPNSPSTRKIFVKGIFETFDMFLHWREKSLDDQQSEGDVKS